MTTTLTIRSSKAPDPEHWTSTHQTYWDTVAHRYDGFYTSCWSRRENKLVTQRLARADLPEEPVVLDLGCGTGLGASLVRRVRPNASYIGVDVSPTMLDLARRRHPTGAYVAGTFDSDITFIDSDSIDCVLALFSTLSFSVNSAQLLRSVRDRKSVV